ncbi:WG repeat-containing protein [Cohnella sp. WQ 127256]|uniref:WG repeat-containing protein n=1 Tax=Cohnella sp. WQ 127256 TaxID=2938790 RepID=UPI002118BDE8|nr:WG repeat-containing protein [Cohnella sp. WQ 127256]
MRKWKIGMRTTLLACICLGIVWNTATAAESQTSKLHSFADFYSREQGYFDLNGKVVIEPQYANAFDFYEGVAAVCGDVRRVCEFIDEQGNVVIEKKYNINLNNDPMGFREGLALVSLDYHRDQEVKVLPEEKVFIDHSGNIQFEAPYDIVNHFYEGLAVVAQYKGGGKYEYGAIDKEGKVVISFNSQFRRMGNFHEGLAWFMTGGGLYGYMDKKGKVVIPATYRSAYDFSEGLARVKIKNKMGYIDKTGKVIIKAVYDDNWDNFGDFHQGTAVVSKLDDSASWPFKHYVIDKKGKVILDVSKKFSNASIADFKDGYARIAFDNTAYNFIDIKGNLLLKKNTPVAYEFKNGIANIKIKFDPKTQMSTYAYIDTKGKQIFSYQSS